MGVQTTTKEKITSLLNEWYEEIRMRNIDTAQQLKESIDSKIHGIEEDQNIIVYYALLNFRYNILFDNKDATEDSLKALEGLPAPRENFLTYYYHFFKALHAVEIGDYNRANESYHNAEKFLEFVPDVIEKAEFQYKRAIYYWQTRQPLKTLDHALYAKELFLKHNGYEINVAGCENIIGLACNTLRQFEKAEEHFLVALNILENTGHENLILKTRQNLGLLYADQDMSELAIRYLSEVIEHEKCSLTDLPLLKANFLLVREYFKLGQKSIASKLIPEGINVCKSLRNKEYEHHYKILETMNNGSSTETLESVIQEGISVFEQEGLIGYVKDYSQQLAIKFVEENNLEKAGKYYHIAHQAEKRLQERESLK
ncbi:hypothetical protein [Bacillus gaemokensis]|uniref:Uncharacterized protein n=1 Tax=Bacillus gaemokensis TaxID=574375 RepID=A0A073K6N9_9BACI|nr:hypothetical protein [Bacillus gaemokensis]KEK22137.1 hypothetical protein BAGA_20885 [Bacillus gaemokensis]KYG35574.1 hypothetical protein AZF08_26220 [Bacillus gaemokensis]